MHKCEPKKLSHKYNNNYYYYYYYKAISNRTNFISNVNIGASRDERSK